MPVLGEVLVLGPENGGKTLLLRRMKEQVTGISDAYLNSTVPTVGQDVQRLAIQGEEVIFREVGSAMSSRWDSYVKDCACLMYVVDVSDCGAIACSLVLLLELLSLPEINGKYILLVFNKIDLAVQSDFDKYYTVMDVDELMGAFRDKMFFFEGTAATATIASNRRGIDCSSVVKNALSSDILEWFKTKYFTSSTLS